MVETKSSQSCSVPLCFTSKKKQPYLSFNSFPDDENMKKHWNWAIRRDEGVEFTVRKGFRGNDWGDVDVKSRQTRTAKRGVCGEQEEANVEMESVAKPNPVYSQDVDSEEECTDVKKRRFPQAPRIVIPAEGPGIAGVATCSSGIGKSTRNVQRPPAAGAQCGPLHSDVKAALSLEEDVPHHEPSLYQHLLAVKEPGSTISSNSNQCTSWNERKDPLYESQSPFNVPSEGHLTDSLAYDFKELEAAERILQNEDARRAMAGCFAIVGGASVETCIRRMLACTLTNELASQMNWAGKKLKNESKRKTAFRETRLNTCIFGQGATWMTTNTPMNFHVKNKMKMEKIKKRENSQQMREKEEVRENTQ
ncbi:hypothetical protein G5714_004492 [Onychostoma macrolepis]|uniref:DUF4806 domain-containing protein n=1 Tax=Onychostoma macrolepis TaxID=369639 RepID=A0A7J6D4T7_9TELE|nr:hypothetical protein G5714_004492 [Onychostoma macrolepis]